MASFEIPLSSEAQYFTITLQGVTYQMTLKWQEAADAGGWFIDIADQNSVPMIGSVPLVTGADLLRQYSYMGFGGALYVFTDANEDAVPTYENIGTESHLIFVTVDG